MILNAEQIKTSCTMHQVLNHYGIPVHGKKSIPCPVHGGSNPNFSVREDYCKCFSKCQKTWDPVGFIMDYERKTYPESLQILAGIAKMQVQYSNDADFQKTNQAWKEKNDRKKGYYEYYGKVQEYWAKNTKGLDRELEALGKPLSLNTIQKFGVVIATDLPEELAGDPKAVELGLVRSGEHGSYTALKNRIAFPIRRESGDIVGYTARKLKDSPAKAKYLNSSESLVFKKRQTLYGLFENRQGLYNKEFCYIVEGPTDVISLYEHNVTNAVASLGTAFTEEHARALKKYTRTAILLFDGDDAGKKAAEITIPVLLSQGFAVRICHLPDGKDPDQYIREESGDAFRSYVDQNNQDAVLWAVMSGYDKNDPHSKDQAISYAADILSCIEKDSTREIMIRELCQAKYLGSVKTILTNAVNSKIKDSLNGQEDALTPDQQADLQRYGFFELRNCYYAKLKDATVSISNFIIKPIMLVLSSDQSYRLVEISNEHGNSFVKDVPSDDFVEIGTFRKQVESQGNFLWKGGPTEYMMVKQKVYALTPVCHKIGTLGWQKLGFWAWANGITCPGGKYFPVNEYGIVEFDGVKYFLPAFSCIYNSYLEENNDYESQKPFIYNDKMDVSFSKWVDDFVSVFGDKGVIAAAWYLSAIFRDIIMDVNSCFPHLFSFGPTGSGKSFLGWSLVSMFGKYQKPFHLAQGTNVGFFRRLSQFRNIISWFDEYSNNIHFSRIEAIKGAFDGTGHEKGVKSQDNRTTKTIPHAATMISGQHQPTKDPALFNRCISLSFEKKEHTVAEQRAANKLKDIEKTGAFSKITADMMRYRDMVSEEIGPMIDESKAILKKIMGNTPGLDDRILLNHSVPLAVWTILMKHGLETNIPVSRLIDSLATNCKVQCSQISNEDEVGVFWQMLEFFIADGSINEDVDFRVDKLGTVKVNNPDETKDLGGDYKVLFLRMNKVHPLYQRQMRMQRNQIGLGKDAMQHYLKQHPAYLGWIKGRKFDGKSKSCYAFNLDHDSIPLELEVTARSITSTIDYEEESSDERPF